MESKIENHLPYSMKIAALAVELSNIKIIPVTEKPKLKHRLWTLRIGDWENRLIKSGVKEVNKDIKRSLNSNKGDWFYVYCLAALDGIDSIKENKSLFVYMDMYYYFK